MSDDHLPEDLSRWPADAFQVLGLPTNAGPREIKRAYTRLLRRFKPEHAPRHFQALRVAYEAAGQQAVWRTIYEATESDSDAEEQANGSSTKEPADFPATTLSDPRRSQGALEHTVGADLRETPADVKSMAWHEACAGQPLSAYAKLQSWYQRHSLQTRINRPESDWKFYAQLYWLLTLFPECDASQQPYEWLVAGLRSAAGSSELMELLRREIYRQPKIAFQPPLETLLASAPLLLPALLVVRWDAACRLDRRGVIASDLASYRERAVASDGAQRWTDLIRVAFEKCSSDAASLEALQPFVEELEYVSLNTNASWQLDQIDIRRGLAAQWAALENSNLPRWWISLLREGEFLGQAETNLRMQHIVEMIARNALRALDDFQRLHEDFPYAAIVFCGKVEIYLHQNNIHLEDTIELPANYALPPHFGMSLASLQDYERERHDLIRWSLAEFVPLKQCTAALRHKSGFDFTAAIDDDVPYKYVFAIWRAFWGA